MAKVANVTVEILKQIRDEIVSTRTELSGEIRKTRTDLSSEIERLRSDLGERIDQTNERIGAVEHTLLDLAQQHRFLVRSTTALGQRDVRTDARLDALEGRVEAIEKRHG